MNNEELSHRLVALLTHEPKYIDRTIVTADMLHVIYQKYFKMITESYREKKIIDVVALEKVGLKGVYQECLYSGIASDTRYEFESVQLEIVDQYKKAKAADLATSWQRGEIDDYTYFRLVGEIQTIGAAERHKLKVGDIIKSLEKDDNFIDFKKFLILKNSLKLEEHDLWTIAADTGVGKTALAINLLDDLSATYPCLYFNIEMSTVQIHKRLIAVHTATMLKELDHYKEQSDTFKNEIKWREKNFLKQRDIEIIDGSQTIEKIIATIASHNQDKHFIVFVDHAGLIGVNNARTANERLTTVYQTLRKLSLDYNCTIISLCQLNRESVKNDPEPKLSALKDSSEIEQSSCKVTFVYCLENLANNTQDYYFKVAKNRSGITGTLNMNYNKRNQVMKLDQETLILAYCNLHPERLNELFKDDFENEATRQIYELMSANYRFNNKQCVNGVEIIGAMAKNNRFNNLLLVEYTDYIINIFSGKEEYIITENMFNNYLRVIKSRRENEDD